MGAEHRVAQLWRYPVKLGSGKNTRRFRRIDGLLACRARLEGDVPVVTLPDGQEVRAGNPAADQALRKP